MKKLSNPYLISFAGLKNGDHNYDYIIDDNFFKDKSYSEIQHSNIKAHVKLTKEINLLVFDVKMEGTIHVTCDRCGDPFDMPVWGEHKLIVNLTNDVYEAGDDIVSIPATNSEIDISHYIYEYVSLLLPTRRIHPDKADGSTSCNAETLKTLNTFLNHPDQGKAFSDPRWEALKKIKQNQK